MTEQEAEAWGKRLERVWGAQSPLQVEGGGSGTGFYVLPLDGVELEVSVARGLATTYWLCLPFGDVFLYYSDEKGLISLASPLDLATPGNLEHRRQLQMHWRPFFQRGLWLSGCAIEASAHEKAEWIQGFGREEVEAWNLKF